MFSGIILERAKIVEMKNDGVGRRFSLEVSLASQRHLKEGSSVSLNGVCFTVTLKRLRTFEVETMPQTLRMTTVPDWKEGDLLNFELSLKLGDEIGGHLVFGHADGVGEVEKCLYEGTSTVMTIRTSEETICMIAPRASVAVDGVSLTVVDCKDGAFRVSLLPETLKATTLGGLKSGGKVNVEIDMLMRYAYQLLHKH